MVSLNLYLMLTPAPNVWSILVLMYVRLKQYTNDLIILSYWMKACVPVVNFVLMPAWHIVSVFVIQKAFKNK